MSSFGGVNPALRSHWKLDVVVPLPTQLLLVFLGIGAFEPGQMDRNDLARRQQRKAHRFHGEPIPTFERDQHDRRLQAAQVDRSLFAQLAIDQLIMTLYRLEHAEDQRNYQYGDPGAFDKLRR